jgi:predicted enzyme related to lactoylglutathione lyase
MEMQIKWTTIFVDDQEKALHFYTGVLGFKKKADFSNGPFRWLTIVSPEDPEGTELQLALNNDPAAKAFQGAQYKQSQPAMVLKTDDVQADFERIQGSGAKFTKLPTEIGPSKIAQLDDTCGNIVQLTELKKW